MAFSISSQLQLLLNKLKGPKFEMNIPYMYLDSVGLVTVGVGHNLDAHKDKLLQPFKVKRFERKAVLGGDRGTPIAKDKRQLNRAATAKEIQNDYDFLKKNRGLGKFNAVNLQAYTTLELESFAIDKLFLKDITTAAGIARKEFGQPFDKFPTSCQAAIIDIAFNTGNFPKFDYFKGAIKGIVVNGKKGKVDYSKMTMSDRWKEAAKESKRPQVDQQRNNQIKQWFLEGATKK
jgi:hypothetical protein